MKIFPVAQKEVFFACIQAEPIFQGDCNKKLKRMFIAIFRHYFRLKEIAQNLRSFIGGTLILCHSQKSHNMFHTPQCEFLQKANARG